MGASSRLWLVLLSELFCWTVWTTKCVCVTLTSWGQSQATGVPQCAFVPSFSSSCGILHEVHLASGSSHVYRGRDNGTSQQSTPTRVSQAVRGSRAPRAVSYESTIQLRGNCSTNTESTSSADGIRVAACSPQLPASPKAAADVAGAYHGHLVRGTKLGALGGRFKSDSYENLARHNTRLYEQSSWFTGPPSALAGSAVSQSTMEDQRRGPMATESQQYPQDLAVYRRALLQLDDRFSQIARET